MKKQRQAGERTPVNRVAKGMICSGTGRKQIFKDRRDKRLKDAKNSWQKDLEK